MVKKKDKHPTLFVFEGGIKHYEDGSMLELHSQLSSEEWELITAETIKYKVFLDKLKTVALAYLFSFLIMLKVPEKISIKGDPISIRT